MRCSAKPINNDAVVSIAARTITKPVRWVLISFSGLRGANIISIIAQCTK
jgi:hypothetical protein